MPGRVLAKTQEYVRDTNFLKTPRTNVHIKL